MKHQRSYIYTSEYGRVKDQTSVECDSITLKKKCDQAVGVENSTLYIQTPIEPRKKNLTYYFPLNPGWLIGILDPYFMVYYNPYVIW